MTEVDRAREVLAMYGDFSDETEADIVRAMTDFATQARSEALEEAVRVAIVNHDTLHLPQGPEGAGGQSDAWCEGGIAASRIIAGAILRLKDQANG